MATPRIRRLNAMQQAFVESYAVTRSIRRAAIASGYSIKNPDRLLKLPHVKREIDKITDLAKAKAVVDAEFVLLGLREVVQKCLGKTDILKHDSVRGGPITTRDFDSGGANRSLELLAKHLQLLSDKGDPEDYSGTHVRIEYVPVPEGNSSEGEDDTEAGDSRIRAKRSKR